MFRLVVASFNEDLAWTDEVRGAVCVYDASGSSRRPGVVSVENRGREAGQYLYHIMRAYPDFYEQEIFVQGNPFDHSHDPILTGGNLGTGLPEFYPLGEVSSFKRFCHEHDEWAARFALEWLGEVPSRLEWVIGAQFVVHRRLILSRSLDYWTRLRDKVLGEETTSPWAIERLWLPIFMGAAEEVSDVTSKLQRGA
jgi:hypothetical protein